MAEQFANNVSTTVAAGGYTAGSGVLNVASTGSPWPSGGTFRVSVFDPTRTTLKAILCVTAINSSTQWAVTAEADGNANAGDAVLGTMITAGAVAQLKTDISPAYPFTIVQEASYQSGGSNVTSFAVTFPQALAASGNTAWMVCAGDASSTVTVPTGWTSDINQPQATYARLVVCHKTSASDTSATWTVATASSFAVWFFELGGARALDISSASGVANINTALMPAITPTAGAALFAAAAFVTNGAMGKATLPLSPVWKSLGFGASAGGARGLAVNWLTIAASHVSTTPPAISIPDTSLFSGGGVAYATFSIK